MKQFIKAVAGMYHSVIYTDTDGGVKGRGLRGPSYPIVNEKLHPLQRKSP